MTGSASASIWHPLFDTPITVRLSREQLQCVQEALLGRPEPVPGWNQHFAAELEKVLQATLDAPSEFSAGADSETR